MTTIIEDRECACGHFYGNHFVDGGQPDPCSRRVCDCQDYVSDGPLAEPDARVISSARVDLISFEDRSLHPEWRIERVSEPSMTKNVIGWLEHNFGPDRDVHEQALVLAEEVGELCRALVKRSQGIRGTAADWTAEVRKEAADAVLALHAIAGTEGFDLYAAVAERWAVVSKRDFKADPIAHGIPTEDAGEVSA